MARCGFFTLDVAWYDEEWFINVPDKDKANVSCLDHSLNGLVMAGYDIPTFKKKHLTPEQVEEKKISFEIPLTEKILKFRRISEVTGWRKGKIIQFLNELEKYGVILFRVEDKLRVSVLHIKAYERLGATQKGYFNALGVNAKTIKAYKIKVAQSYGKISKTQDDDSFPEKENQSSGNENKLPDTFFLYHQDCWGWATWKRSWKLYTHNSSYLLKKIKKKGLSKKFNLDDKFFFTRYLEENIIKRKSWATNWYASLFINDKLNLFPGYSMCKNIGFTPEATHSKIFFTTSDLSTKKIKIKKINFKESKIGYEEIVNFYSKVNREVRFNYYKMNISNRIKKFLNKLI